MLLPGARLVRSHRTALHMNPSDLALQCRLSVQDLDMLEQGRFVPLPRQAYLLASTLAIDLEDFCDWALAQLMLHPQFWAGQTEAVAQG